MFIIGVPCISNVKAVKIIHTAFVFGIGVPCISNVKAVKIIHTAFVFGPLRHCTPKKSNCTPKFHNFRDCTPKKWIVLQNFEILPPKKLGG
jgi:hypothetical protein